MSDGQKKEVCRDVQFFHGASQLLITCIKSVLESPVIYLQ